jgi:hypothetical protein
MAKRSRGATRPGQRPTARRPAQRPAGRAGAAATTDALRAPLRPVVDDDASGLEPIEERPAVRARRDRDRADAVAQVARVRISQPSGLLAQRAAQEYGYVARDVRHIGVVGGGILVVLVALYLLIEVAHVITL